jgi:hypothetical protein
MIKAKARRGKRNFTTKLYKGGRHKKAQKTQNRFDQFDSLCGCCAFWRQTLQQTHSAHKPRLKRLSENLHAIEIFGELVLCS